MFCISLKGDKNISFWLSVLCTSQSKSLSPAPQPEKSGDKKQCVALKIVLGPVVQKPINSNPRLKVNEGVYFSTLRCNLLNDAIQQNFTLKEVNFEKQQ